METTIHYYRFSTENVDEAKAYKLLREKLTAQGLKCFASIAADHHQFYRDQIKPLDGKKITLETTYIFDNQWNTAPTETSENGLRVFDWAEAIYPNRDIKEGQYLDITPEMREIRNNTAKCGYCGKQYAAQQGYVFCNACLDSEYLKESDLHLLRLLPCSAGIGTERKKLTEAERNWLLPQYIERQTKGGNSRNAQKFRKQREKIEHDYKKSTEAAQTKHDGLLWLMDNNVSIDNCIYYDHTDKFCFGWRNPVSESVKSELLDILVEFPFDYEIK